MRIHREVKPEALPALDEQRSGAPLVVQTKLAVGRADDPLERDADHTADLVMRALRSNGPFGSHDVEEPADGATRRIARSSVAGSESDSESDHPSRSLQASALTTGTDALIRRVDTPVASNVHEPQQAAPVTVAPITGAHEAVSADPITVASVRSAVASKSVSTADDAAAFLAARVAELKGLGLSSSVPNQAGLIPVLAADMKRKDQQLPESERKNLDDDGWTAAASSQILGNQTTALTTSDDRYTEIAGGEKFDELHEFIHICSAPGGESALMGFKLQVNEGAINYFSQLAAAKAGVSVVARYTTETDIVTRLVKLAGPNGPSKLYDATFKGDIDGFFAEVGKQYVANKKFKGFSEKSWTAEQAGAAFKDEARKWGTKFIQDRT
jgi:hypothetical protein